MKNNLDNYLEKYSTLFKADKIREWLIDYCQIKLNIVLSKKDIVIKNGIARISGSAALRSELFLRQKEILDGLKQSFDKNAPTAIR